MVFLWALTVDVKVMCSETLMIVVGKMTSRQSRATLPLRHVTEL